MTTAFGIIYAVIALVAFCASGYMTYHDLRGTGDVEKGHISIHAFVVLGVGLFASIGAALLLIAA